MADRKPRSSDLKAPAMESTSTNGDGSRAYAPATGASPVTSADVFPDFAITLDEANRRVRMLQEFARDHMVDGEDYGIIPGGGGKPTLFKPGAEKLNSIFGFAPLVAITNRLEDWDTGFVAYEVKVTLLNKRTGCVEAEGIGLCNSRERRYRNQDAANIANTVLKMSKKRALVDATLSATRASGLFSQDLEDQDTHDREAQDRRAAMDEALAAVPAAPAPLTPRRGAGSTSNSNSNTRGAVGADGLTEAQRGAILSIANKAFGRSLHTEMAKLVDKPIAQLSKGEASALIDRLRNLLPDSAPEASSPARTGRPQPELAVSRNGTTTH